MKKMSRMFIWISKFFKPILRFLKNFGGMMSIRGHEIGGMMDFRM